MTTACLDPVCVGLLMMSELKTHISIQIIGLLSRLSTPCNKAVRYLAKRKKIPKPDLELVANNEVQHNMVSEINKHLQDSQNPETIDEMQLHLVNALSKGREVIPLQKR